MKLTKTKYKHWRVDLNKWEEKKVFLRFIPYYIYSIWQRGKISSKFKFRKIKGNEYIKSHIPIPEITITQEEFERDYHSNKWLVPLNRIVEI